MRILHFVSHFSYLSETFIYDEITGLEKLFPQANTVLTFERLLEKERPHSRVTVLRKTPSLPQKIQRFCLKHLKRKKIPRNHFTLYSYLSRHFDGFEIFHAHFAWNAIPLFQALKLTNRHRERPVIVQCRGSDINSATVRGGGYLEQLLEVASHDNVVFTANSEFMKDKLIKLGIAPSQICRVANAFNNSFLTHRKKSFFKSGDCLKLIHTGRFIRCKGQAHLVKGFARFTREVYPNSTLTLIGQGETFSEIKALVESEGVSAKVNFLGAVPHADVARLLSLHDLYVQPSIVDPKTLQAEGLPVAVLEALAVGLPLIVTRVGGLPEIVGDDHTFARIIPPEDPQAICRALTEMFEAGSCFQDTSAYSKIRLAAFSQEKQLQDLTAAYAQGLESCRRRK